MRRPLCLAACLLLAGCRTEVQQAAGLLTPTCRAGRCAGFGAVKEASGLTADSDGFALGPGPGELDIDLAGVPVSAAGAYSWEIDALVRGEGNLVGCAEGVCYPPVAVSGDWQWVLIEKQSVTFDTDCPTWTDYSFSRSLAIKTSASTDFLLLADVKVTFDAPDATRNSLDQCNQ